MKKNINILIPGLLWQNISDAPYIYKETNTPNLDKLLKKASYNYSKGGLAQVLYKLKTNDNCKSIAYYLAEQLQIQNEYKTFILCEPTHLRLDRDRLLISESELLQLDDDETLNYIDFINQHFEGEIKIYYIHEELWLLGHNCATDSHIRPPIINIIGENIDDYMNMDSRYSHKLNAIINEIQMLLYNCKFNQARTDEGSIILNSVWLSDIDLSNITLGVYNKIYTNNLNKLLVNSSPFDKNTLQKINNNELIILDDLYYPNCYLDAFGYIDRLNKLDQDIFSKLMKLQGYNINLVVPKKEHIINIQINKTNIFNWLRNNSLSQLTKDTYEI